MSMLSLGPGDVDIAMVNGSLVEVTGLEEVRQHLVMRLRLWRGELWYNTFDGVDYENLIFPARNVDDVLGELRKVALGTPGVTECTLAIEKIGPDKMTVSGSFIADLVELDDLIKAEFGPIDIIKGNG